MMWALEYDPDLFSMYEEPGAIDKTDGSKGKAKSIRHFGKYERDNLKNGGKHAEEGPLPITVFLVASVLREKSAKLLHEAHGLDDVVKVSNKLSHLFLSSSSLICWLTCVISSN